MNTIQHSFLSWVFASIFLPFLLLTGCGGGGGGDAPQSASNAIGAFPNGPTQDPTGLWTGTITINGFAPVQLAGIISGDEFIFITGDGSIYRGTLLMSGNQLTATTTLFSESGLITNEVATITGVVDEGVTISGDYSTSGGDAGSFSINYDGETDKGASLATVNANWSQSSGGYTVTVSIDLLGAVTGSDTDGCVYNGSVSVPDAEVNIYETSVQISSCGILNGTYTGFGVISDDVATDDELEVIISNSQVVLLFFLDRV